jgi:hypothetical protein
MGCNGMGMLYKNQEDGAKEAEFIQNHIIKVTDKAFDDFAVDSSPAFNKKILGL